MTTTTPLLALAAEIGLRHETIPFTDERGRKQFATVTYGFDLSFARKCNQAPHFTATIEVRSSLGSKNGRAGGADLEMVAQHFPHLAPFLRWHLASTDEPMHYAANGLYWYLIAHGRGRWQNAPYGPDPIEALHSTILYGAAPGDEGVDLAEDPIVTWDIDAPRSTAGDHGLGLFTVPSGDGERRVVSTSEARQWLDDQITTAFQTWLAGRFDAMMAAFAADMTTLAGLSEPQAVS